MLKLNVILPVQIYHPNINVDGAICLGLRKAWKPVMDLKYICYGLLTILQDPNPMDPLNMGLLFKFDIKHAAPLSHLLPYLHFLVTG